MTDFAVIRTVAVPLLLALVAVAAFDMVTVAGPSMEPTISSGERLVVFRGAYGWRFASHGRYLLRWREPERGDIVLLESPIDGNAVVKRCVGVPGDRLLLLNQSVYIDGTPFPLGNAFGPELRDYRRVPPGEFFLVGDNPDTSIDSRHYGPVSARYLLGKVIR